MVFVVLCRVVLCSLVVFFKEAFTVVHGLKCGLYSVGRVIFYVQKLLAEQNEFIGPHCHY
jgi:hypothetical protein